MTAIAKREGKPMKQKEIKAARYDQKNCDREFVEANVNACREEYAEKLLSIDVNISITEMLDTAWELFGKYFTKAETGIKQSLIDKYWKGR